MRLPAPSSMTLNVIVILVYSEFVVNLQVSAEMVNESQNDILESVEKIVIEQYFASDKCIVLVIEDSSTTTTVFHDNLNLSYVIMSSADVCQDINLVDKLVFAIQSCCYSYVLRVSNPKCVLEAWGTAQLSYNVRTYQRKPPKFLVNIHTSDSVEIVDELMSAPVAEITSDLVIAVLDTNSSDWHIALYTNNFYVPVSTPDRELKIFLDRWDEQSGFKFGTALYPDKIFNLQGKELKAAVVDLLPYSELNRFIGQEAQMLTNFCSLRNCTMKGVGDEWFWGEIFENGSGNGILGMVFDGRAEFGIGGVYIWESLFNHVEFSTSYLHSGVKLLVPKPVKVGGWLIPFLPFGPEMWLAYIISVTAAGISMHLITKATIKYTRFAEAVKNRGMFLTPVDTTFRSLGLSVLQQPSTPLVPHTPIRHLFTSFEILYLVFCTVYAAELASYLTAPQYSKPIDTLTALAGSGMLWLGEHNAWTYSLLGVVSPTIEKILSNFRIVTLEEMDELAVTGKYGLIVERLAGGHYSKRSYLSEKIVAQSHVMEEYLYDSPVVTVMRKASPYREHYNKFIGRVLESGLILYWEAEASRLYLSSWLQTALQSASRINMDDEARPLTLSDCLGMLLLYFAGILISMGAFLSELWKSKREAKLSLIQLDCDDKKQDL